MLPRRLRPDDEGRRPGRDLPGEELGEPRLRSRLSEGGRAVFVQANRNSDRSAAVLTSLFVGGSLVMRRRYPRISEYDRLRCRESGDPPPPPESPRGHRTARSLGRTTRSTKKKGGTRDESYTPGTPVKATLAASHRRDNGGKQRGKDADAQRREQTTRPRGNKRRGTANLEETRPGGTGRGKHAANATYISAARNAPLRPALPPKPPTSRTT